MSALRAPMGVVINTYTVAYDANGGTGSMSDGSSPYINGASFQVLANAFAAPADKHFTGWNTAPDGTGIGYTVGSTYTISGNVVLYAQWASTTIQIYVYAGNNESNELEHREVTATDAKISQYIASPGFPLLTLLQSDYGNLAGKSGSFSENEVYSNGQIKLIADGAYNYKVLIHVKKDTVLTSYTVKCLDEFNNEIDSYVVNSTRWNPLYVGDSVEEDAPYFFGYILTSADSQQIRLKYSGNTITFYYSHKYTVSYDANGGYGYMYDYSNPYYYGETFIARNNHDFSPSPNKHFAGWNTAANGSGTAYAPGDTGTITGDVTLYAQWAYDTYTVTYNANGGSGTMTDPNSPYNSGSSFIVLGNTFTAPANMHFVCWNTAANGHGNDYAVGSSHTINSNRTLYAKWAFNSKYTLTYNANGGSGAPMTDTNSPYYSGSTFTTLANTFNAPANKRFAGWNTAANGTGTAYAANATGIITGNTTLYAQWAYNTYTVSYNANGGGGTMTDGNSPYNSGSSFTVMGNTFTAPANKHFVGWSNAAGGGGTIYNAGTSYTISGNVTLYAQWAFNAQYTVTYQANGGSGTMTDTSSPYYSGNSFTVLANGFTAPANKHFTGWNTAANGTGTSYTVYASYNITANVTLYAQWEYNPLYTVSYDANGGTGTTADALSPYYDGNPFTVMVNGFSAPANKHFTGWNTSASGDGTNYTAGSSYTISGNVVLYAQWAYNSQFTVTYQDNGGSGTTTDALSPYYDGNSFTVLANGFAAPANKHFTGWNTAANGTGTSYTVDASYTITSNVTLYAQWAFNPQYTVLYDANGGTGSTTDPLSPYYEGNSYTVLANGFTAPANKHFTGWNTAANGTGTSYTVDASYNITANVTLYAQWAYNALYTVSYDANGGTGTTADALSPYYDGNPFTVMANGFSAPANKHFTGWNTSASGDERTIPPGLPITSPVTWCCMRNGRTTRSSP